MVSRLEQTLRQAVTVHKEGKLQDAERLYRAVLQSQPLHPDANHNLGVLAVSVDKVDAAIPLFKAALRSNPKVEQYWLSLIDALIRGQQFEIAELVLKQARGQGIAGEKIDSLQGRIGSQNNIQKIIFWCMKYFIIFSIN